MIELNKVRMAAPRLALDNKDETTEDTFTFSVTYKIPRHLVCLISYAPAYIPVKILSVDDKKHDATIRKEKPLYDATTLITALKSQMDAIPRTEDNIARLNRLKSPWTKHTIVSIVYDEETDKERKKFFVTELNSFNQRFKNQKDIEIPKQLQMLANDITDEAKSTLKRLVISAGLPIRLEKLWSVYDTPERAVYATPPEHIREREIAVQQQQEQANARAAEQKNAELAYHAYPHRIILSIAINLFSAEFSAEILGAILTQILPRLPLRSDATETTRLAHQVHTTLGVLAGSFIGTASVWLVDNYLSRINVSKYYPQLYKNIFTSGYVIADLMQTPTQAVVALHIIDTKILKQIVMPMFTTGCVANGLYLENMTSTCSYYGGKAVSTALHYGGHAFNSAYNCASKTVSTIGSYAKSALGLFRCKKPAAEPAPQAQQIPRVPVFKGPA